VRLVRRTEIAGIVRNLPFMLDVDGEKDEADENPRRAAGPAAGVTPGDFPMSLVLRRAG
jgi:hypothetical protein